MEIKGVCNLCCAKGPMNFHKEVLNTGHLARINWHSSKNIALIADSRILSFTRICYRTKIVGYNLSLAVVPSTDLTGANFRVHQLVHSNYSVSMPTIF